VNVDQLIPPPTKRVEFSLRNRHFVPSEPGCYALATFSSDVVYIGLTNNLYRRLCQHRDAKEKREPTSLGIAFWFHFLTCDEGETYRIERTWLNEYVELHGEMPTLNKVYSPVR
jgi:hypothetical protein